MKYWSLILWTAVIIPAWGANVHVDHDHGANFSQFHTYCWGNINSPNPLYVDRIRARVDAGLHAAGWQLVSTECETTVFANGNVHNQQEVTTYYSGLGGWGLLGWGGGTATSNVTNQSIGQLVIDIFNSKTKSLIWRGTVQQQISPKEEKNIKALNNGIDKMFKGFPPGPGA